MSAWRSEIELCLSSPAAVTRTLREEIRGDRTADLSAEISFKRPRWGRVDRSPVAAGRVSEKGASHEPLRRTLAVAVAVVVLSVGAGGTASADTSPNGPGQPGARATTCGSSEKVFTPGNAVDGRFTVQRERDSRHGHAGNPGTAPLNNATSPTAVSQYDVACFQVSSSTRSRQARSRERLRSEERPTRDGGLFCLRQRTLQSLKSR
jgi:hypothetical protein